jgi:16S rRNA (adenine1518-N6/adenine1519-N6)-dimethyltransferase
MVARLKLPERSRVLEIGAGPGALTRSLLTAGHRVVSVEIDDRFEAPSDSADLRWIRGDFLELDLDQTPIAQEPGPWRVVANIPYYITTPILQKLLGPDRARFTDLYLLMQTEVAERILAEGQRESGALTLFIQYHAVPTGVLRVPGRTFHPPARVDSTFLHLALRPAPPVSTDPALLFDVIHLAFGQRRKMLRTTLRQAWAPHVLEAAFQQSGVEATERPERLSLQQFARLADALPQRIARRVDE